MRRTFLFALILSALAVPAFAQNENLDIVKEPICFAVRNQAPYKVYGNFATDNYITAEGIKARHRSNFRLDEPGTKDEKGNPTDAAEFCSYGPFLPNRMLELTLRTLVPIFSCKTKIDQGEIIIKGHRKEGPDGGTETWAECYL